MVEQFMCHVDLAMRTANSRRRQLVLLGIKPDRAESGYGWMEPAGSLGEGSTLLRVTRFWEKPPKPVVRRLWQRGLPLEQLRDGWYSACFHHDDR
jgi:mannose-1-phosphate guanylyltransferase